MTSAIAFSYTFNLAPDCLVNGLPDGVAHFGSTADCNHNGVLDACDIFNGTVLDINNDGVPDDCIATNCPPDFNRDGILDPDDLADYISAFFSAPPPATADYNCDGLVDPDDLADYIGAYFAGC